MRTEVWLAVVCVLFALPAHAELRRPSLQWTRGHEAGECIDPLTLAERVEALTGPVFMAPYEYAIEGHIDAVRGGWRTRLTVTGNSRAQLGERELEHLGSDCRSFDDAIVFVIALMIDPDLDLERLTGNPALAGREPGAALLDELEQQPPVSAPVEAVAPAPEPAPVAASPRPPYRWYASVRLQGAVHALAKPAVGGALDASFPVVRWFELAAQLRVLSTARKRALEAGYDVRAQSFALAALACARPLKERFGVRVCAGPEPSLIRARGLGFASGSPALLSSWGALAQLELAYRVGEQWAVLLEGFVRVNLEAKRLTYTSSAGELREVDRLDRASGGMGLGVMFRFGSGTIAARATHAAEEPK